MPNEIMSQHFFKCRLGLPVVHERSGAVTMKSIDMYILHDSSLVVLSRIYWRILCKLLKL